MTQKLPPLFRPEAQEATKEKLHGEVILKQTMSSLVMIGTLVLIIAIAMIWVTLGEYARTESVRGILRTSQPSSKIVAPRPGLLTQLNVSEGQLVRKGEEIAIVDIDRQGEDGTKYAENSLTAIDNRIALADQQKAITASMARANEGEYRAQIFSNNQQMADLANQIHLQEQIVESNRSLFDKVDALVARGFVSKIDYENRRQNYLNSQQALSRLRQQSILLRSRISEARAQLAQTGLRASQDINDLGSTVQGLLQQRAQLQGEKSYRITAPISGRVTAIQASGGKTVQPNVALMTIIPEESDLEAVLYAPTRAIGFVDEGQETRLLLDAFPYQRFGSFGAEISEISRNVLAPGEVDAPFQVEEPVYKVTAKLTKQSVVAYGDEVSLQPGMTLTGNMVLERQSFLDWILTPLRAVVNRS